MKKRRLGAAAALAKGLIAAVLVTLLGMLLMAAAVIFIGMGDGAIRILNQFLKIIAVFLGTLLAVGRGGVRGWSPARGWARCTPRQAMCSISASVTPPSI